MQDMPSEALGDVQGRLRRPKISCGECEATGSDIRLFVYALDERGSTVRVVCTGCGGYANFHAKSVRPQDVSAGVHEGVAKAPKGKAAVIRWGIPETLTLPDPPKRSRAGRPRKHTPGAEPWVKAGIPRSRWYRLQAKG